MAAPAAPDTCTSEQLWELLVHEPQQVVLVDTRPPWSAGKTPRIGGARCAACYFPLVSGTPATRENAEALEGAIEAKDRPVFHERAGRRVVVYDDKNETVVAAQPSGLLIAALRKENKALSVQLLKGGYAAFAKMYPDHAAKLAAAAAPTAAAAAAAAAPAGVPPLVAAEAGKRMGPPPKFQSLVHMLRERAAHMGNEMIHLFLDKNGQEAERMTYGQLDQHARSLATALNAAGVTNGQRVLLLCEPGLRFIQAFFGCLYAGAVVAPTYPPEPANIHRSLPRLVAVAKDAQVTVVLASKLIHGVTFNLLQKKTTPFTRAAMAIRSLTKASNDDKLQLYAYFKQATEGNNNRSKPGFFDVEGRAKWDVWAKLKDMTREQAEAGYIAKVEALLGHAITAEESHVEVDEEASQALLQAKWITIEDEADGKGDKWRDPQMNEDALAFIQYTSGSTGNPKGVMLTHGNLLDNSRCIYECFGHTKDSVGVIWLPPYHDMGLIGGILQPAFAGFPVVLMAPMTFLSRPQLWLEAITKYKGTVSGGPNFAYDLCMKRLSEDEKKKLNLSSWRVAFSGAEPVRPDTINTFAEQFAPLGFRREAFLPCYGLAEATLLVSGVPALHGPRFLTCNAQAVHRNRVEIVAPAPAGAKPAVFTDDPQLRTLVSCGIGYQTMAIVDPATNKRCAGEQIGEVWVSSASVARGYWGLEERTAETMGARIDGEDGSARYLRTGDLGFLQHNEIFIVGRIKDLIIIKGKNHHANDIEHTVDESDARIRKGCCAAFSVDVRGQERLVVVAESNGEAQLSAEEGESIASNVRRAISRGHQLHCYAVGLIKVRTIPKTTSGKIQRFAVRASFLESSLELVAPVSILQHAAAGGAGGAGAAGGALSMEDDATLLDGAAAAPDAGAAGLSREDRIRAMREAAALKPAPPVVDPTQVRALLEAAPNTDERRTIASRYAMQVLSELLEVPVQSMDPESALDSYGIDSATAVQMKSKIEDTAGLEVPLENVFRGESMRQIVEVMVAKWEEFRQ